MYTIAALKERVPAERRVALVPESVKRLVKQGARVLVEFGAGLDAGFTRREYEAAPWRASAFDRGSDPVTGPAEDCLSDPPAAEFSRWRSPPSRQTGLDFPAAPED